MSSFPRLSQPLSDGIVTLRQSAERDIPEVLIAYQDDPELHLRLGQARPPSGAQLGRSAEQAEALRIAGVSISMTIADVGEDMCRGGVSVHAVDWENRRAELGIWVAPGHRGRGLARRALVLAGGWLLRDCELERVGLMTEPDNERLIRAARAAGFSEEGVLRGYALERGGRVDNAVLSIVRPDLSG
jgi:ribosomal-protein-alanine N-acetyltransferase